LEASALGSLIAACPAWKRREERERVLGGLGPQSPSTFLVKKTTSI